VPNVDINALQASTITQGSEDVVVAVIDDGVDFSHPDLADRAWENPGESGVDDAGNDKATNNIDDDDNGYIDDVNGYDLANDDNTVHDALEDGHGTHIAGTIAASVNNQGVVGVAPNVKIMAVKFLGGPFTTESNAIKAIEYASDNGAKISNNSWGYIGPPSKALEQAIENSGMLFVAAAGNGGGDGVGDDNDADRRFKEYPASYDSPNILTVAAVNNRGRLASFSNYGQKTVDISAPGVQVLSTVPSVPAKSGATLSDVGTMGGKALVAGFGVEEISGNTARAAFMKKALESVGFDFCGPGVCTDYTREIVLVDDDLSSVFPEEGVPDVAPVIAGAIESATAGTPTNIEVIEVGPGSGPDLTQLQGKLVVWATGWAFFSSDPDFQDPKKTLTFVDQNSLTRFLNGGRELVLTGMDALFMNENSAFVTDTLGLDVVSDYPTVAFEGAAGTGFEGQSYTLKNAPFSIPFFHDIVAPADPKASSLGLVSTPQGYEQYASGTSMAVPHAVGTAALVASEFPNLENRPVALKKAIMQNGKPLRSTQGKTVTGDMVNAKAAVTNGLSGR
jgi:subtilisin family serine protease